MAVQARSDLHSHIIQSVEMGDVRAFQLWEVLVAAALQEGVMTVAVAAQAMLKVAYA